MLLIIDRNVFVEGHSSYHVQFGVDYDIMIGVYNFVKSSFLKKHLSELDKLITSSAKLKNCFLYIHHPLLMRNYQLSDCKRYTEDISFKNKLRNYWALRLKYRRCPIELIEYGSQLF